MQGHVLLLTIFSASCGLTMGQHLEWCEYYRRQGQTNRPECVVQGTISTTVCQSRPNEIYMDCGSPCPGTCTNPNPNCAAIAHNCVVNCFCRPGFVRDMNKPNQPCVQPQQCSTTQSCPAGEVYRDCDTPCQPNCLDRNPSCSSSGCVAGCFCQTGLIRRSPKGMCVPVTQCTNNQCPVNEVYQQCGSACPSTCQNRNPTCVQMCVAGCFCAPGFLRDLTNGQSSCVAPNMCSSTTICTATERYMLCGTPCQPSCSNRNPTCQSYCAVGCFCLPGYVRNDNNICVLPHFCPVTASKTGMCPPPIISFGQSPLTVECSGDYDCSGTMKCCSEGSGSRLCRYPAGTLSTKVGQCPVTFSALNTFKTINCFDDNNCPGSQKCCVDFTGRKVCAEADVAQIVLCAAVKCPINFSCVNNRCMKLNLKTGCSFGTLQCGPGYNCINNLCIYTDENVISKANTVCPTNPPKNCQSEPIVIACSNDSDCDNNWKCCQATFCGGRICKEGVLVTTSTK